MKPLLLLGGGGHCRSCIDVIEDEGEYHIKGIVQHPKDGNNPVLGYPILGINEDLPKLVEDIPYFIVAVGQIRSADIRIALYEKSKMLGAKMAVVISSKSHVSRHAFVEEGSIVMHGAIVNAGARIGINAIINSMALIEHDAVVGDHCHISTGAMVNGDVVIGSRCFIGSGVIIHQGVSIGDGAIISAGSIVRKHVPSGALFRNIR